MSDHTPWLIVGLGNPGPEYASTRHNVGAMVAAELGIRIGARFGVHKRGRADIAEGRLVEQRVVVAVPRSYMNESGGSVKALLDFYKIPLDRLIVVHDELDIDFATLRVKYGGGDNGHNGLRSVRSAAGSGDFFRVRVGIGRPPGRQDPAAFVLKPFAAVERKELPTLVGSAADSIESLISDGLDDTQSRFNS